MKRRNLLKALFGVAVAPVAALATPAAPLATIGRGLTSPIFMVDDSGFQRNIMSSNLCPEIVRPSAAYMYDNDIRFYYPHEQQPLTLSSEGRRWCT